MKDERVDAELKELLAAARPEMAEGWERRLRVRLREAARPLEAVRPTHWGWRVAGVVVILMALGVTPLSVQDVRNLAEARKMQTLGLITAAEASAPGGERRGTGGDTRLKAMCDKLQAAVSFAQSRFPNDPEMLMAAGLISADRKDGLRLLEKAAREKPSPTVQAAYVGELMIVGPRYRRAGNLRVGPDVWAGQQREHLPVGKQEERVQKMNARDHLKDRLTPEEARPILEALRTWQRLDPQNAYPVIQEVRYLYGLHEDRQALARWEAAARLPKATWQERETNRAVGALLNAAGYRDLELLRYAAGNAPSGFMEIQESGWIADFEARRALSEGRPRDAVRWWKAAADLGDHLQQRIDYEGIGFSLGYLLERTGVSPSWVRQKGESVYYYGPQHALFVSELGEAEDAALRDRFLTWSLRQRLRLDWMQRYRFGGPDRAIGIPVYLSVMAIIGVFVFGLGYLIVSVVARRKEDQFTPAASSRAGRAVLAGLTVLPALGLTAVAWGLLPNRIIDRPVADWLALSAIGGGIVITLVLAFLLPYRAARREPAVSRGVGWRTHSRRFFSALAVVCAVFSLLLWATSKWQEKRTFERIAETGVLWDTPTTQEISPLWDRVTVPPALWRAEYPPKEK